MLRIGYSSSQVSCSCDIHVTDSEISYLDIQGAHDQQIRTSSQWQAGSFEAKNVSKVKSYGFEKKKCNSMSVEAVFFKFGLQVRF